MAGLLQYRFKTTMKVLDALAKNHQCFRVLIDQLETELQSEIQHGVVIRHVLGVLLPALDRHEEIEDMVFHRSRFSAEFHGQSLSEVEHQHQALALLRSQILAALERLDAEKPAKLHLQLADLVTKLRTHLDSEEYHLWPVYRAIVTAISDEANFRLIGSRVRTLERQLTRDLAAIHPAGNK